MRTNGLNAPSISSSRVASPKGVRQTRATAGVVAKAAPALYLSRENVVRAHPRLAVEMRDAQQDFGSKEVGLHALQRMHQYITLLQKNLQQGNRTRALDAEFDRLRYSFKVASETKVFGRRVIASNFKFCVTHNDYIYFHVPGLNLDRERDEDEVVSLFLADKLISLPMRRVLGMYELRREIVATFGRQLFDVKFMSDNSVVIGMLDSVWREWDRKAFVSGWGFRYASGPPVSMPVIPSEPVAQQVLDLSPDNESADSVLKRVGEAIGQRIAQLELEVSSEVERIQYLRSFVGEYNKGSIRSEFLSNPRMVLSMIGYAFNGPSRSNVIRMIQES